MILRSHCWESKRGAQCFKVFQIGVVGLLNPQIDFLSDPVFKNQWFDHLSLLVPQLGLQQLDLSLGLLDVLVVFLLEVLKLLFVLFGICFSLLESKQDFLRRAPVELKLDVPVHQ